MMSLEEFRRKAGGYPIDEMIKQAKNDMGVQKVRVMFDNPNAQAMSKYNGPVLEIHLPDVDTVLRQKPELTREEAVAKIKAATCEELAHGRFHETNHDEQVVGATMGCMVKHLSKEELAYPYIQQKIERLKQASQPVIGTPIVR